MSIATIAPTDALARIGAEGDAVYVDVRTVAEFVSGRPKGRAVNIPVVFHHPGSGAEHPNEAFTLVARHALAIDTPVIVGGAADARALSAARALDAAGFARLALLEGGLPAWQAARLPLTGDNRDGVSYVSLLTRARRAK
ncbi:MAG: rhodanese-like domain-containing protein [Gammaproteobacteria bacterium]